MAPKLKRKTARRTVSKRTDLRTREVLTVIRTDSGPIVMNEFAEFLQLFRIAYAATLDTLRGSDDRANTDTSLSVDHVVRLTKVHLRILSEADIARLGTEPLEVEPTILTIHRENPLIILTGGLAIALAAAVILSGGKFKTPLFEAELQPLGKGIELLRKALRRK